jgi:hypothetical protein
MQPNARSALARSVFLLIQAPMLSDGRREHGREKQQEEKISPWMNITVKTTEGRLMTHAARVYATLDDWIAHEAISFSPGLQRRR